MWFLIFISQEQFHQPVFVILVRNCEHTSLVGMAYCCKSVLVEVANLGNMHTPLVGLTYTSNVYEIHPIFYIKYFCPCIGSGVTGTPMISRPHIGRYCDTIVAILS